MTTEGKTRIMVAKFGLDGHDNGIKVVSKWLRDAGFEVIYMGIANTAERVIKAALEEDVDIIGGSFLEQEHLFYAKKLVELARENKMDNVRFIFGGVIPPDDVLKLKEMGIKEVYTPGTPREVIINSVKALSPEK